MAVNDIVMGAAGATPSATFVEDVFSTWLYTGNGSTQTITNGIDLSGKGGLVWIKNRLTNGSENYLQDTNRGSTKVVISASSGGEVTRTNAVTSFNSTGFSLGADSYGNVNANNASQVSWSFRKQAKFFDVVTYTGTGANRTIAHNLGSIPGCIMVKRLDTFGEWQVYHRSLANTQYLVLNAINGVATGATVWNSTTPTSSVFSLGTAVDVNASGGTYVAYIFAHDAGGFGALGTDNVISCGSYTGNGDSTGPIVTLGYEPQYLMIKQTSVAGGNWQIIDNIRGMPVGSADTALQANGSGIELIVDYLRPTATGFQITSTNAQVNTNTYNYIYIAIRRPMKTPTTGSSVFGMNVRTGTGANVTVTGGSLPTDAAFIENRTYGFDSVFSSRLTSTGYLATSAQAAEVAAGSTILQANPWDVMNGVKVGTSDYLTNNTSSSYINYLFTRAAGFFDVVCYVGTGIAGQTYNHNLTVAPELWIIRGRNVAIDWQVGSTALANTEYLVLNTTAAKATGATRWNSTYPTSSVFSLGTATHVNAGYNYVAYLFASLAGVSKVGSYTGNGSSQTINCSFTTGARFIMIKRTDNTGDWFYWDTARGIVAGNDPHLSFNTAGTEVTTDDSVDAASSGFIVNQLAATNINVTSATYIFLAIA